MGFFSFIDTYKIKWVAIVKDKSEWLQKDGVPMEPWDDENMFIITNPNDDTENTTTIKYNQINDIEVLHNALANSGWKEYNVDKKQYLDQFDEYFPPQTNGGGKKIRNKVKTRSNRMKRKGKITRKNKITRRSKKIIKSKTRKNH